ncbi:MAG: hypothetical protein Q4A54_08615 [Parabacteroides sp.]|nr:hypothetical protein [Parabacteroides sp.]
MDEIIQLIIFVAAMGISLFVQRKAKTNKKPASASPQEVLEEMFPELDQPQETEFVQPMPSVSKPTGRKKQSIIRDKQTTSLKVTRSEKKIKLNTKEEARRAFIYSEIFNRKY